MGLGCSGEILPSPPPSPPPSPTRPPSRLDFENCHFSSFITESELPECADQSVSSSDCRRLYVRQTKSVKKIKYKKRVGKRSKTTKNRHSIKIPYRNIPHSYPLKGAVGFPAARSYRDRPQEVIGFHLGTSGDHLGTIWEIDSMKLSVSLRIRIFRSARIDPSSLPKHRRTNFKKSCRRTKPNLKKQSKHIKNGQNGHSIINLL